jgi:hypothetical protein
VGKHGAELSKSIARGMSRRASRKRFVTGLAGGLLAGILPGRVAQVAEAKVSGCRGICREAGFTQNTLTSLGQCTGGAQSVKHTVAPSRWSLQQPSLASSIIDGSHP